MTYGRNVPPVANHAPGSEWYLAACGAGSRGPAPCITDKAPVSCKRCLATLAKRDRAFRRTALRWFNGAPWPYAQAGKDDGGGWWVGFPGEQGVRLSLHGRVAAARAIAAEEGR